MGSRRESLNKSRQGYVFYPLSLLTRASACLLAVSAVHVSRVARPVGHLTLAYGVRVGELLL